MKLNLDLARHIMQVIEGTPFTGTFHPIPIDHPDHSPEVISRHVEHLHHAGLIKAEELPGPLWMPTRLTHDGHEFLAHASSPLAWETTKARMAASGDASIAVADRLLWEAVMEILDRPEWDCGAP